MPSQNFDKNNIIKIIFLKNIININAINIYTKKKNSLQET